MNDAQVSDMRFCCRSNYATQVMRLRMCRVHNLAPEGMLLENNSNLLNIGSEVELLVSRNDRTWTIAGNCHSL